MVSSGYDDLSEHRLSFVMYPWFAMGHLTAFLHLSNKLADKGHRISFILPTKSQSKLKNFNLHPHLIKFFPLTVPKVVEGLLPPDAETTSDIPAPSLHPFLRLAMDRTQPTIESLLREIRPHFVFYDFQHWLPSVARPLGIKAVHFATVSPATVGYSCIRENQIKDAYELTKPPCGYPSPTVKYRSHEARGLFFVMKEKEIGSGMSLYRRLFVSISESDAVAFKACREMEGPYCEFLEKKINRPVILAGPVVPVSPSSSLEEKWEKWLNGFKPKAVVFCAFGSECVLKRDQFHQLLLGFELTGLPFLVALKPPVGAETVEEALPEGFKERTQGRGVVHGGWVQQQLILAHPSVGCFVSHCGSGSITEGLVSECQMVLLPHIGDQVINARVMGGDLKVGVEVEKGDEDGLFTKETVCRAVRLVMDENSEIGKEVRANHARWREFLLREGLETAYIDEFVHKLRTLITDHDNSKIHPSLNHSQTSLFLSI